MTKFRRFSACLLCASVLVAGGTAANSATHVSPNYTYGDLLVQRGYSSWNRQQPPSAAPQQNAAPTVIPAYPYSAPPSPPLATSMPPAPPLAPAYTPLPPPVTEAAEAVMPRRTPLEQPAAAEAPSPDFAAPAPLDYAPVAVAANDEQRYVSGPPVAPHPGYSKRTKDGLIFVGPSGIEKGYEPNWFKARLGNGYRSDKLEVKYVSPSLAAPGARSELKQKWDGLASYELRGGAEFTARNESINGFHMEGEGSVGFILSGDAEDKTQVIPPDNSVLPESQQFYDFQNGDSSGFRSAIGYEFSPDFINKKQGHTSIIPLIGYALEDQEVERKTGDAIAGVETLNYQTSWRGPYLGLKLGFEWPEHRVALRSAYHYANYEGKGNIRNTQIAANNISYKDKADAHGFLFGGNYSYNFYNGLEVFIDAAFQAWSTDSGISTISRTDGTQSFLTMDEATWRSQSYQIGLSYRW